MSDNDYQEVKFHEDYTGDSYSIANKGIIDDPIDHLEPLLEVPDFNAGYRAGAKRFYSIINSILSWIIESENARNAAYAVAFAMGLAVCNGRSMNAVADKLGLTRAALSKSAKQFARSLNLPPSAYMKSADSSKSYREARIESINHANNAINN